MSGVCAPRSLAARPGTVAEEVSCKAWVRGQRGPSAWTFGPWACRTQQYVVKSGFCLLEVALPFPTKEFICSADRNIGHCPEASCTAGPGTQNPRPSPVLGSALASLPRQWLPGFQLPLQCPSFSQIHSAEVLGWLRLAPTGLRAILSRSLCTDGTDLGLLWSGGQGGGSLPETTQPEEEGVPQREWGLVARRWKDASSEERR